jgi:hypothetical protein
VNPTKDTEATMAEENTGADIRLSGYLPGQELNGLALVKDLLWKRFEQAWRDGDTTHEGLRVPVVAVLEVQTVKVPIPGSEEQPTVNVKMLMVEPALLEADQKVVTELLTELRGRRRGDAPTLETPDGEKLEVPASNGTGKKRGRKPGQLVEAPAFTSE